MRIVQPPLFGMGTNEKKIGRAPFGKEIGDGEIICDPIRPVLPITCGSRRNKGFSEIIRFPIVWLPPALASSVDQSWHIG